MSVLLSTGLILRRRAVSVGRGANQVPYHFEAPVNGVELAGNGVGNVRGDQTHRGSSENGMPFNPPIRLLAQHLSLSGEGVVGDHPETERSPCHFTCPEAR